MFITKDQKLVHKRKPARCK